MNKSKPSISRRDFARKTIFASAAVSLLPVSIAASQEAAAPAAAADQGAADPKLSAASQAEVDSRIQAVLAQYGERLDTAQKADIRRLCAAAQPGLDRLRAYSVGNGDGSALYLKPLIEHDKVPSETRAKKVRSIAKSS